MEFTRVTVPRRGLNRSLPNIADLNGIVSTDTAERTSKGGLHLLERDAILCDVIVARLPHEGDITSICRL